jgi:hypothetical protein
MEGAFNTLGLQNIRELEIFLQYASPCLMDQLTQKILYKSLNIYRSYGSVPGSAPLVAPASVSAAPSAAPAPVLARLAMQPPPGPSAAVPSCDSTAAHAFPPLRLENVRAHRLLRSGAWWPRDYGERALSGRWHNEGP